MSTPVCLVASDEEDVDGNLQEVTSTNKTESLPIGEVIYLPEDTSNFQPEEEPLTDSSCGQQTAISISRSAKENKIVGGNNNKTNVGIKVGTAAKNDYESRQIIQIKPLDSLRKIPEEKDKSVNIKQSNSDAAKGTIAQPFAAKSRVSESSSGLKTLLPGTKAADLMPPPLKRGGDGGNTVINYGMKKTKYARQATPICDAIMREYSKRQKLLKQKGSSASLDISDIPIQELIKKAKGEKGTNDTSKQVPNNNTESEKLNKNTESENPDKEVDPLSVTPKQEIIETKPAIEIIDVKTENSAIIEPVHKETHQNIDTRSGERDVNRQTQRGRGRGRPPRTPVAIQRTKRTTQRKRKWNLSEDEDDTDEDPDFDPSSVEQTKCQRVTRFNKTASSKQVYAKESAVDTVTPPSNNEQENCTIQKKALSVAERLKFLAEKISDVLMKEPSPNIHSEAEKLLQTTQELIEMQKKTLQNSGQEFFPNETPLQIKKERDNDFESVKEPLAKNQSYLLAPSKISSTKSSLHIFNQLQKHEAALQKKLTESSLVNCQVTKVAPGNTLGPITVQEKCNFIMDYFTAFKDVFSDIVFKDAIPSLTVNVMQCLDALTECVGRLTKAETLTNEKLRQEESSLARQAYIQTVKSAGSKFFQWFNVIVEKISRTKTSKALIMTLTLFITGSLYNKAPKYQIPFQRLKRVILFMIKVHGCPHHQVSQVLQASEEVFDNEMKLVRHMLKYFLARGFISIPVFMLCNFLQDRTDEDKLLPKVDASHVSQINTNKTLTDGQVERIINQYNHNQLYTPSTSTCRVEKSQQYLANITTEFVEALRSVPEGNIKRIEQKLDSILNALSGNTNCLKNSLSNLKTGPSILERNASANIQRFPIVNLGMRVANVPTVKVNTDLFSEPQKTSEVCTNNSPNHAAANKGVLLAQLLENDHSGLDGLFSDYLSSGKERLAVKVKAEPLDIVEHSFETSNVSDPQIAFNVKQEPVSDVSKTFDVHQVKIEPLQPVSTIEDYQLSNSTLTEDVFFESFTEEFSLTKDEKTYMDYFPLS